MKKIFAVFLVLVLLVPLGLIGCDKGQNQEKLHILFLGDSIGEGIAGVRPVSERERDAYYGIIGERNGYDFKNRAISGSRSRNLLELIRQDDEYEGVRMTQSLIRNADIIHVSILGNDLLLANIPKMISTMTEGDYSYINEIADAAQENINQIVATLKEYNPNALLLLQPVYNPIFPDNTLITEGQRQELLEKGIKPSEYREVMSEAIEKVNNSMHVCLANNPGSFYIVDVYAEFNRIFDEDMERGMNLIFVDDAHPSAEGHAVMANLIQEQLEELGYADNVTALKKYKDMRIAQLKRLYKKTFKINPVIKEIKKAKSCSEVSIIYFDAIRGQMPVYY